MEAPYGPAFGIAQAANGALQGIVQANMINRQREVQDREFGLQEKRDARDQGLFDARMEEYRRTRQQEESDLLARTRDRKQAHAVVQIKTPDAVLPPDHPDATPDIPEELEAPVSQKDAMPLGGLTPARAPRGGGSSPVAGISQGGKTGQAQIAIAQNTGKANAIQNHETLAQKANTYYKQANDLNEFIHAEVDKLGLDPNSREWRVAQDSFQRTYGPRVEALAQAGAQAAQEAEMAKRMNYGRSMSNYMLAARDAIERGDKAGFGKYASLASPYLEALDPEGFKSGIHLDPAYIKSLTPEVVDAIFKPSTSEKDRLDALRRMSEMREKALDRSLDRSRIGAQYNDPMENRLRAMREADYQYGIKPKAQGGLGLVPAESATRADGLLASNRYKAYGMANADTRIGTGIVNEFKAREGAELGERKLEASIGLGGGGAVPMPQQAPAPQAQQISPESWAMTVNALKRAGLSDDQITKRMAGFTTTPAVAAPPPGLPGSAPATPSGITQGGGKALPPAIQAKVDALRTRKVSEAQITAALKQMGY